ncbi:hypothetical protein BDQ17DRAFT_1345784 [Cyathus striatus]|nr:hypothetical protein BDQ17DRAFT_1345784 [Cyathus striatus]
MIQTLNVASRRAKLLPELQEEIISTFWNSRLSPQDRIEFIWSVSLVSKHWKGKFVLCAFRDYHFSSVNMYNWYLVTINRQSLGQDAISKDLCRSITFWPQLDLDIAYMAGFYQKFFSASYYPNLRSIYVEDVPMCYLGSQRRWPWPPKVPSLWLWLDKIPAHVSSLHLTFVLPTGTRFDKLLEKWSIPRDWRDWSEDRISKGAASITHLNIEGVDDGNLAWGLFGYLFPNVAIMSCGGHLVERPPVQQKSINTQNIISYQDYMSNINKRQELNKKMNRAFKTIVQQISRDLQDAERRSTELFWRISGDPNFYPVEEYLQEYTLAQIFTLLMRQGKRNKLSLKMSWCLDGDSKLNRIEGDYILNTKLKDLDLEWFIQWLNKER